MVVVDFIQHVFASMVAHMFILEMNPISQTESDAECVIWSLCEATREFLAK